MNVPTISIDKPHPNASNSSTTNGVQNGDEVPNITFKKPSISLRNLLNNNPSKPLYRSNSTPASPTPKGNKHIKNQPYNNKGSLDSMTNYNERMQNMAQMQQRQHMPHSIHVRPSSNNTRNNNKSKPSSSPTHSNSLPNSPMNSPLHNKNNNIITNTQKHTIFAQLKRKRKNNINSNGRANANNNDDTKAARPTFQFKIGMQVGVALGDCFLQLQKLENSMDKLRNVSEDITDVMQCIEQIGGTEELKTRAVRRGKLYTFYINYTLYINH